MIQLNLNSVKPPEYFVRNKNNEEKEIPLPVGFDEKGHVKVKIKEREFTFDDKPAQVNFLWAAIIRAWLSVFGKKAPKREELSPEARLFIHQSLVVGKKTRESSGLGQSQNLQIPNQGEEVYLRIVSHYADIPAKTEYCKSKQIFENETAFIANDSKAFACLVAFTEPLQFSCQTLATMIVTLFSLQNAPEGVVKFLKEKAAVAVKTRLTRIVGEFPPVDLQQFISQHPQFSVPLLLMLEVCEKVAEPDWKTSEALQVIKSEFAKLPVYTLFAYQLLNRLKFNPLYVARKLFESTNESVDPSTLLEELDFRVLNKYKITPRYSTLPFSCKITIVNNEATLTLVAPTHFFWTKSSVTVSSGSSVEGFKKWLEGGLEGLEKSSLPYPKLYQTLVLQLQELFAHDHSTMLYPDYSAILDEYYQRLVPEQRLTEEYLNKILETRNCYEKFILFAARIDRLCSNLQKSSLDNREEEWVLGRAVKWEERYRPLIQNMLQPLANLKKVESGEILLDKFKQRALPQVISNSQRFRKKLEALVLVIQGKFNTEFDLTAELQRFDSIAEEQREISDDSLQKLLLFLEKCESCLASSKASSTPRESSPLVPRNNFTATNSIDPVSRAVADTQERGGVALQGLGELSLTTKEAIKAIVNRLAMYIKGATSQPKKIKPAIPPQERMALISTYLKWFGLSVPKDPQFETLILGGGKNKDVLFNDLYSHFRKVYEERSEYMHALEKGERGRLYMLMNIICVIAGEILNDFVQVQGEWSQAFSFGSLIQTTVVSSSMQIITDSLLLLTRSPSCVLAHKHEYPTLARNLTPDVCTAKTLPWARALIFHGYSSQSKTSEEILYRFRVDCDLPYQEKGPEAGTRLFTKGNIIIGYGFPVLQREAETSISLDLTELHMNLEETEQFLTALTAFVNQKPDYAEKEVETNFASNVYMSQLDYEKKAAVITTFISFNELAVDAVARLRYYVTAEKTHPSVQREDEKFNKLAEIYEKCDKLLTKKGLEEYLDRLIPLYRKDSICKNIIRLFERETFDDRDEKPLSEFAELIATELFPKEEERKKFSEDFIRDAKKGFTVESGSF